MPGGSAGHEDDVVGIKKLFLILDDATQTHRVGLGVQSPAHGVAHDGGLFVDLLHHEMVEAGLLDTVEVHLQLLHVRDGFHVLDGLDMQLLAQLDAHDLLVFDVHHFLGAAHDRGGVGRDEVLAVTDADDHRAALAGGNQLVGMTFLHDGDGVCADHVVQGDADGLEEIDMLALLHILDEVGEHLRVRGGVEDESALFQLLAETQVVLDDAVVNQRDVARLGEMRVSVGLVRLAVGGPSGVGDADVTAEVMVGCLRFQIGDFALGLVHIQLVGPVQQCHASTVITTIFKTFQSLNENRVGLLIAHVCYNSTHIDISLVCFFSFFSAAKVQKLQYRNSPGDGIFSYLCRSIWKSSPC